MSTFQERIEDHIGTLSKTITAEHGLNTALEHLAEVLPPNEAHQYATEKEADASAGVSCRGRVTGVRVDDRQARVIPSSQSKTVQSSDSIHTANKLFPVAWYEGGMLKGYPNSSQETIYASVLEAPEVTLTDDSADPLPQGSEELAVLYATSQVLFSRASSEDIPTSGAFPTAPTAPDAPSFTYTDAVAETIGSIDIEALPAAPIYDGPTSLNGLVDNLTEGQIGITTDQIDPSKWFSTLAQLIENEEDPELANQAISRVQSFIQAGAQEIQNAMGDFQASLEEYKGEVEERFNQAQINLQQLSQEAQLANEVEMQNSIQDLQRQVQEYQAELQRYQSQMNGYSQEVQVVVSEFETEMNEYQASQERALSTAQQYYQMYQQQLQLLAGAEEPEPQQRRG